MKKALSQACYFTTMAMAFFGAWIVLGSIIVG